jgi:hypothetical protein
MPAQGARDGSKLLLAQEKTFRRWWTGGELIFAPVKQTIIW